MHGGASKRSHVAAWVLNRPPTSTPTTTKRQRRARTSSGYVWRRLRRAAPTRAWPGRASAPGCASPARVIGLTMVASIACWEPCQSGRPLATTSTRRSSETGTSMFMSARRTFRATRAPASWHGPLKGQSAGSQHARVCTRSPVVTKRVEATPTSACAWRDRQRKSQASQQDNPELRRGDRELRGGWEDCQGTCSVWPSLRQQQRTRCGIKVRKMQLERALIAGCSSKLVTARLPKFPLDRCLGFDLRGAPVRHTITLPAKVGRSLLGRHEGGSSFRPLACKFCSSRAATAGARARMAVCSGGRVRRWRGGDSRAQSRASAALARVPGKVHSHPGREHAEQVVGSGRGTKQQKQPRGLQVRQGREPSEQGVLRVTLAAQLMLDEGLASKRGTED